MSRDNPQPGDRWKSRLTNSLVTVIKRETSQTVTVFYDCPASTSEMDLSAFKLTFFFVSAPEEATP